MQNEIFNQSALSMINLKKRNREHFLGLEKKKSSVDSFRERIGQAQLKLENLLYKKAHLIREIQTCQQISTPAVTSVEQELATAIAVESYSSNLRDLHRESLEKLRTELARRKTKQATVYEAQNLKNELEDSLDKKRKILEGIPEKLSVVAASTSQLSDLLQGGGDIPSMDSNIVLCTSLPAPLYVLFRSLSALSQTEFDVGEGSRILSVSVGELPLASQSSSGQAERAVDLRLQLRGISSGFGTATPTGSANLVLRLRYIGECGAVCVSAVSMALRGRAEPVPSSSGGGTGECDELPPLFPKESILRSLFPCTAGASEVVDGPATDDDTLGVPYLWAQWLCGLLPLPAIAVGDSETPTGRIFSLPAMVSSVSSNAAA